MPTCVRCGYDVRGIVAALTFNSKTKRCSSCENEVKNHLKTFRKAFIRYSADGVLTDRELAKLYGGIKKRNIDWNEAIFFIRHEVLDFLERNLDSAMSDGIITDEEIAHFQKVIKALPIPREMSNPILERFEQMKLLSNAQQELNEQRQRYKKYRESENQYKARIMEILGASPGTTTVDLSFPCKTSHEVRIAKHKINLIKRELQRVKKEINDERLQIRERDKEMQRHLNAFSSHLGMNSPRRKNNQGPFSLANHVYQSELNLIDQTLFKLEAELIDLEISQGPIQAGSESQYPEQIPQDLKIAIWERDQGKCVICGDTTQLNFVYIIPYDKGGENSINNIQLLCSECNLKKDESI